MQNSEVGTTEEGTKEFIIKQISKYLIEESIEQLHKIWMYYKNKDEKNN